MRRFLVGYLGGLGINKSITTWAADVGDLIKSHGHRLEKTHSLAKVVIDRRGDRQEPARPFLACFARHVQNNARLSACLQTGYKLWRYSEPCWRRFNPKGKADGI